MWIRISALVLALAVYGVSLLNPHSGASAQTLLPVPLNGMQLMPGSPADLTPGQVFSVDHDTKERHDIAFLDTKLRLPIASRPIVVKPAVLSLNEVDILKLLRVESSPAGASYSGKLYTITVAFDNPKLESLPPGRLDADLTTKSIIPHWNGDIADYYMVETIMTAQGVVITLGPDSYDLAQDLSEASANGRFFRWVAAPSYTATETFDSAQVIAVGLQQLVPRGAPLIDQPTFVRTVDIHVPVSFNTLLPQLILPQWTYEFELPMPLVVGPSHTFLDAFERIHNAMVVRGHYKNWWVYGYGPDGFAVVGLIESTDDHGRPRGGLTAEGRFELAPRYFEELTLSDLIDWIEAGLGNEQRNYRMIAFVVTPRNQILPNTKVGRNLTSLPQDSGHEWLPVAMQGKTMDPNTRCVALIYEFASRNSEPPSFIDRIHSTIQPTDHLSLAGFWTTSELTGAHQ